jgi:hypothetical protein
MKVAFYEIFYNTKFQGLTQEPFFGAEVCFDGM